jgi:hypothetical protein
VSGGGTASGSAFPNAAGGFANPSSAYRSWLVGYQVGTDQGDATVTSGNDVATILNTILATSSPYNSETTPSPDTLLGSSGTGSQAVVTSFNTLPNDIDVDPDTMFDNADTKTDFGEYATQAKTSADTSGMFPSISIASDVVDIHTAERSAISSAISDAVTAASSAIDGAPFADMIDAYSIRIKKQYLAAMSRFVSGMADINAVNSSAFIFGVANIERQMLADVNAYAAGLDIDMFKSTLALYLDTFKQTFSEHMRNYFTLRQLRANSRDSMILQGVAGQVGLYDAFLKTRDGLFKAKLESRFRSAELQHKLNMDTFSAQVAEHNRQMEIDVEDLLWDIKAFAYPFNYLGAAGGATNKQPGLSPAQQTVSAIASVGSTVAQLAAVL